VTAELHHSGWEALCPGKHKQAQEVLDTEQCPGASRRGGGGGGGRNLCTIARFIQITEAVGLKTLG